MSAPQDGRRPFDPRSLDALKFLLADVRGASSRSPPWRFFCDRHARDGVGRIEARLGGEAVAPR
jgi:hypothetical protein